MPLFRLVVRVGDEQVDMTRKFTDLEDAQAAVERIAASLGRVIVWFWLGDDDVPTMWEGRSGNATFKLWAVDDEPDLH